MDTKEWTLGQTTYEVSRFFNEARTVQEALSQRILQNLARPDPVDGPQPRRYNKLVGGPQWRRIKNQ